MKKTVGTQLVLALLLPAVFAEFKSKPPEKIQGEVTIETLPDYVWPGMTMNQVFQIIGENYDETLRATRRETGFRYGLWWFITEGDSKVFGCVIFQKVVRFNNSNEIYDCYEHYRYRQEWGIDEKTMPIFRP